MPTIGDMMAKEWGNVPICHYCETPARLVKGTKIYPHRPDLASLNFWECAPCKAYVGCHKGTTKPLGRLANKDLRSAKSKAHAMFDPLWRTGHMTRSEAYAWLRQQTGLSERECHIGEMTLEQCEQVSNLCINYVWD